MNYSHDLCARLLPLRLRKSMSHTYLHSCGFWLSHPTHPPSHSHGHPATQPLADARLGKGLCKHGLGPAILFMLTHYELTRGLCLFLLVFVLQP